MLRAPTETGALARVIYCDEAAYRDLLRLTSILRGVVGPFGETPKTSAVACLRKAAADIALPAATSHAARETSYRLRR